MIIGIGVDLIEAKRVEKACEKEHFLKRCFTEAEIDLIQQDKRKAADNFAVKEAVSKMFGTGFRGFSLTEIEVLRDELGCPYVVLYGNALALAEKLGIMRVHVSITNTRIYSNAYVIGEGKES
ncbi:holo-ACP synthase [Anaerosporobacter faecicola]|uniref:holo-ACP synthase n=1 Tax=Anaerosporobacter faecicola TaxID=2718714 RepID=UPI00143A7C6C|nr:holo-ACP synthase [Anaerosporobacter faecicola]